MSLTFCPSEPIKRKDEKLLHKNKLLDLYRALQRLIITQYLVTNEFRIYSDYQQNKHEDSSQWGKDPYRWKDNTLQKKRCHLLHMKGLSQYWENSTFNIFSFLMFSNNSFVSIISHSENLWFSLLISRWKNNITTSFFKILLCDTSDTNWQFQYGQPHIMLCSNI